MDFFHIAHIQPLGFVDVPFGGRDLWPILWPTISAKITLPSIFHYWTVPLQPLDGFLPYCTHTTLRGDVLLGSWPLTYFMTYDISQNNMPSTFCLRIVSLQPLDGFLPHCTLFTSYYHIMLCKSLDRVESQHKSHVELRATGDLNATGDQRLVWTLSSRHTKHAKMLIVCNKSNYIL